MFKKLQAYLYSIITFSCLRAQSIMGFSMPRLEMTTIINILQHGFCLLRKFHIIKTNSVAKRNLIQFYGFVENNGCKERKKLYIYIFEKLISSIYDENHETQSTLLSYYMDCV